jgi:hypothetical protein
MANKRYERYEECLSTSTSLPVYQTSGRVRKTSNLGPGSTHLGLPGWNHGPLSTALPLVLPLEHM